MYNKRFAKKHYKDKRDIVYKKILDIEFLVDEYKQTREGFRNEYDRIKEMQDACEVRIAAEKAKEDSDKTILQQMKKLHDKYDPDIKKLEAQMEAIDKQIEGPLPQGQQTLVETMDGLRAVSQLLISKIKRL